MKLKDAVEKIQNRGLLLVYPLQNRPEPRSLWSEFYPRTKMRWEWDSEGADNRVANLWHLREAISRSGQVVYTKWFRGRATFLSKEIFSAFLALLRVPDSSLSRAASQLLRVLEEDSPLSTKELKKRCRLVGPGNERVYSKALQELWDSMQIVGYGEVDDGAFPSLAIGATRVLFDELVKNAESLDLGEAEALVQEKLGKDSVVYKYFLKRRAALSLNPVSRVPKKRKSAEIGGMVRYEDLVRGER